MPSPDLYASANKSFNNPKKPCSLSSLEAMSWTDEDHSSPLPPTLKRRGGAPLAVRSPVLNQVAHMAEGSRQEGHSLDLHSRTAAVRRPGAVRSPEEGRSLEAGRSLVVGRRRSRGEGRSRRRLVVARSQIAGRNRERTPAHGTDSCATDVLESERSRYERRLSDRPNAENVHVQSPPAEADAAPPELQCTLKTLWKS